MTNKPFIPCRAVNLAMPGLVFTMTAFGAPPEMNYKVDIEGSRPLAQAARTLENRHGLMITYEDPRYVHNTDLSDATLRVRRDLDARGAKPVRTVLIPREGAIHAAYFYRGEPGDALAAIELLLSAHSNHGNPGVFRVAQVGDVFHVVGIAARNEDGALETQQPLLDVKITLQERERTLLDTVRQICDAVTEHSGHLLVVGTVPTNFLVQQSSAIGARQTPAREVLLRSLAVAQPKTRLSWQVLYDPGVKLSVLNIHAVPALSPGNKAPSRGGE
jgi:hypothetical protein